MSFTIYKDASLIFTGDANELIESPKWNENVKRKAATEEKP